MMRIDKVQKDLQELSTSYKLIEKAVTGCKQSIKNLVEEDGGEEELKGRQKDELVLEFNVQSLVFASWETDDAFIKTEIGIFVKDPDNVWARGLKPIGRYILETNLHGEDIDDWLIID